MARTAATDGTLLAMPAKTTTMPIDPIYGPAVWTAVVLQLGLTFLVSLILDGGKLASAGGCALVGFWAGVAMILLRRPRTPRPLDLLLIRWGYVPLLIVAVAIAVWLGKARL